MKSKATRYAALFLIGLVSGCSEEGCTKPNRDNPPSINQNKGKPMTDTKTKTVLDAYVVYSDKDDQFAGQLALESGMLSIVSAESDEYRKYLEDIVEDMNATKFLVDLAPPKDLDAPRYSVGADEYDRDHPDFEKVLVRKLLENHSLKVEPTK